MVTSIDSAIAEFKSMIGMVGSGGGTNSIMPSSVVGFYFVVV